MSDYLWDKSGDPDPDIQKLERLLAPLAWQPKRRKTTRIWVPVGVAAAVALLCGAAWLLVSNRQTGWEVRALAGHPSVTRLAKGQSLTTDAQSRVQLDLEDVGQIEIEPSTSVRVVSIHKDEQRLELARGVIHAQIWAPPGQFYVNTPSAVTVDLGCAYTLKVDGQGIGVVQVSLGWVAFESDGRESFIPAEAACETRPGRGPGIPYYEDAAPALQEAVHQFDADSQEATVGTILAAARSRDAITLWHLLRRVNRSDRGRVYDRLAELIRIPDAVTRERAIAGDPAAVDALWDSLDLGDTSWWRMWKAKMPK